MYRMLLVSIKHMDGSRPMLACIVSFYHDIENDWEITSLVIIDNYYHRYMLFQTSSCSSLLVIN